MDPDSKCPRCGATLPPPGSSGGRPRRWCSTGCQRSGESQMRNIHAVIKRVMLDKAWQQRHMPGRDTSQFDVVIAEWQQKYDTLAGVPERGEQ
jgi:hypothetical protein